MNNIVLTVQTDSAAYQIGEWVGAFIALIVILGAPVLLIVSIIKFSKTKSRGWLVSLIITAIPSGVIISAVMFGLIKGIAQRRNFISDEQRYTVGGTLPIGENLSASLPDSWVFLKGLNPDAIIQVGNLRKEEYMVVHSFNKIDFDGSLEAISRLSVDRIISSITMSSVTESKKLSINGLNAYQTEISGKINNINICYLHTFVEGKKEYYQLLGWTLKSKKENAFPVLKQFVNSLIEPVGGGDAAR